MLGGGNRLTWRCGAVCSRSRNRWMDVVAPHFHVVADRSPRAPAWSDRSQAPAEAPIWIAARRARPTSSSPATPATGPPPDEHGAQVFGDVLYLDPGEPAGTPRPLGRHLRDRPLLLELLDEPALEDEADDAWAAPPVEEAPPIDEALPPSLVDFLYDVVRRREEADLGFHRGAVGRGVVASSRPQA